MGDECPAQCKSPTSRAGHRRRTDPLRIPCLHELLRVLLDALPLSPFETRRT